MRSAACPVGVDWVRVRSTARAVGAGRVCGCVAVGGGVCTYLWRASLLICLHHGPDVFRVDRVRALVQLLPFVNGASKNYSLHIGKHGPELLGLRRFWVFDRLEILVGTVKVQRLVEQGSNILHSRCAAQVLSRIPTARGTLVLVREEVAALGVNVEGPNLGLRKPGEIVAVLSLARFRGPPELIEGLFCSCDAVER